MIIAIITGFAVAGSTGNPVFGLLAGIGWMLLVAFMDNNRARPPGSE